MRLDKISKTKMNNIIFEIVLYLVLILLAVLMLYPLLFVLSASFSDPKAVAGGEMILLPISPSLDGYRYLLQYKEIWIGYANTVFYVFLGTILNLAAHTSLCVCRIQKRPEGSKISDDLFHDYHVFQWRNDSRIS